jgi:hypothetical protein
VRFHSHAESKSKNHYRINALLPVFSSRTLTTIHITCVCIDEINLASSSIRASPLQTLVLEECPIHPDTLIKLLSIPKNLVSLTMRHYYYKQSWEHLSLEGMQAFVSAIRQHERTLEYLEHKRGRHDDSSGAWIEQMPPSFVGLTTFSSLKQLKLDKDSPLVKLLSMPPPHLESFHLENVASDDLWEEIVTMLCKLASIVPLRHIEINVRNSRRESTGRFWLNALRTTRIIHLNRAMEKKGITVKVVLWSSSNIVPPFLIGEPLPVGRVLLDSSAFLDLGQDYQAEIDDYQSGSIADDTEKWVHEHEHATIMALKIMAGYKIRVG